MKPTKRSRYATSWAGVGLALCQLLACSPSSDGGDEQANAVRSRGLAFSDVQNRILGFEAPLTDWTDVTGWQNNTQLSVSDTASEGEHALGVTLGNFTVLSSPPLGDLGNLANAVSVDISVPEELGWGQVKLVVSSSSAGWDQLEIGQQGLTGLSVGEFHTLHFALPVSVRNTLSDGLADVRVGLVLNAPALSQPYLIDQLVISEWGAPVDYPAVNLHMDLPRWAHPSRSAVTALGSLRINDRAQVVRDQRDGWPAAVANAGSTETNLGVDSLVSDVTSVSDVTLRNDARVAGSTRTAGTVTAQQGADGGVIQQGVNLAPASVQFSIEPFSGPDISAEGSLLPPGVYGRLAVQENLNVILGSGVYFFTDIYVGPERRILLSPGDDPIIVFVSGSVSIHGSAYDPNPEGTPRWLLAYSGTQEVVFGAQASGALFAPHAKVNLPGEVSHWGGAVLAKDVELHQGSTYAHRPLEDEFDALCEISDGSGGFCEGAGAFQGQADCLFGLKPWVAGRNGHDPFTFKDLLQDLNINPELTEFLDKIEQSPRVFARSYLDEFKEMAHGWGDDYGVLAAAWGDIDGDGRDELLVARNSSEEQLKVYDDAQNGFREIQGIDVPGFISSITTGDYDDDGRDEVVVGTAVPDVPDLPPPADPDGKVFVYDAGPGGTPFKEVPGYEDDAATLLSCDGSTFSLELKGEIDIGDSRDVHDVVLANLDSDTALELAVAISGKNNNWGLVRVIQIGQFANGPSAWNGVAQSSFAHFGERHATAVAVGDFEGDGLPEIAVGRSEGDGDRYKIYRFNPVTEVYDEIFGGGAGWESGSRRTTELEFGDLDGDGDDELVVGRSGDQQTQGPRLFVVDIDPASGTLVTLKELAHAWGSNSSVNDLAVGDIDGDGRDEIVASRNATQNARVAIYDDLSVDFAELESLGTGWGGQRLATAVAIAPRYVCQAFSPEPVAEALAPVDPSDEAAVAEQLEERVQQRRQRLLEIGAKQLLGKVNACQTESDLLQKAIAMFGPFEDPNGASAITRVQVALGTVSEFFQLGSNIGDEREALLAHQVVNAVDAYILDCDFKKFREVGTGGDFDFELMALLELIYEYRQRPDLLSDEAVAKIMNIDCLGRCTCGADGVTRDCLKRDASCTDLTQPVMRVDLGFGGVQLPETENHVLMINTWKYLMAPWHNPMVNPRNVSDFAVQNTPVEDALFDIVGRVLKNGMFETNARPYSAYSIRALQLLASYAPNPNMRQAAENALNFIATKAAFQSLHGKRSGPMRRQWENRRDVQLDKAESLNTQFGMLTGDYVFDDGLDCIGTTRCKLNQNYPHRWGFASTTHDYRVPNVIMSHMLDPEQGTPGAGTFARMQARYREGDYALNADPPYVLPASVGEAVEPAHEFYFRTADYLSAAGGRYEQYSTFDDMLGPLNIQQLAQLGAFSAFNAAAGATTALAPLLPAAGAASGGVIGGTAPLLLPASPIPIWELAWNPATLALAIEANSVGSEILEELARDALRNVDFLARPTMLIGGADTGYWPGYSSAEAQTLLFRGNHEKPWQSNNTGVYKNFAVGYSTRYEDGLVIPPSFRVAASGAASGKTFRVLDPETTTVLFPNHDYYLVVGRFSPGVGFYEVVPRDRFPTPEALLANVLTSNQANAGRTYRMVVSGENIVVSSSYPDGAPFFSINGSTAAVAARHHTGTGQTAGFPLIEAQEVDGDYQFTGRFFACATGDGLLLVNSPSVGKRLVVDSRTNTAPRSCTQPFVVDDCPAILSGTVPPSVSCP